MKILLIGSGGREHAIAWRLLRDDPKLKLFTAPGNAGTGKLGTNLDLSATDLDGLVAWAQKEKPDLTVVGPEAPLCAGVVDRFEKAGLPIFGPNAAAARLEGSKVFTKNFPAQARAADGSRRRLYRFDVGLCLQPEAQCLSAGVEGGRSGRGQGSDHRAESGRGGADH